MKFNDAYSQMFPGYPDAVSLQQAAEMLGLNRHTVGELIRSHRLFALKIGRTYRIPKLSVIEFLLTGQSTFPAGNPPLDDSPLLGCRGRIWETLTYFSGSQRVSRLLLHIAFILKFYPSFFKLSVFTA